MLSVQNKTFDEIRLGDTASAQRTLQTRDVRAWAAAFGDAGSLADAGDMQGAAGIVTAILTALVGSALPGPGSSIRSTAVQVLAALPIDAVLTAQLVVREKRADERLVILAGQCTDPAGQQVATALLEVVAPDDAAAARSAGTSAGGAAGALPRAEADAYRRGAPVQRRGARRRGGGGRGRADRAGAVRAGGGAPPDRRGREA